jgi:hypothetical protein
MLIHRQNSYAESGAPFAMKRRAVKPVSRVKILPLLPSDRQKHFSFAKTFFLEVRREEAYIRTSYTALWNNHFPQNWPPYVPLET